MELKVWVEGIQRIVCGVTDTTTCQDVVYALAHATGKTGRFTLIEKWRNSERLLAPHEHPLKILLKWGEYASDVQFILQRTALEPRPEVKNDLKLSQGQQIYGRNNPQSHSSGNQTYPMHQKPLISATLDNTLLKPTPNSPPQSRDIKKSLTFSGGHSSHLSTQVSHENVISSEVGALQGFVSQSVSSPHQYPSPIFMDHDSGGSSAFPFPSRQHYKTSPSRPFTSLTRPPAPPPYELVRGNPPPPPACSRSQLQNTFGPYSSKECYSPSMFVRSPPPYPARHPHPNMSGSKLPRELPPYRDPPPPPPPSHPALMKISPQGKTKNQVPSSIDSDKPTTHQSKGNELSSHSHIAYPPESSLNHDGNECSLTSSRGLPPHKSLSPFEEDSIGNSKKNSPEKVKKDGKKLPCETSITPNNNHPNSSPSKQAGQNNNPNVCRQTTPLKNSFVPNNKDNLFNSVPDDINDNLVGSVSSSVENNGNHMNESPVPIMEHRGSPLRGKEVEHSYVKDMIKQLVKESNKDSCQGILDYKSEQVVVDNYYRELVHLVNQQREKISAQQIDLTKYEAEIAFTEGYCKEEESRLNYIKSEIQRLENVTEDSTDNSSHKYSLDELEEQLREAQASETLAIDEVTTIKKNIANYDQQLNQMKNKIRALQDVLENEETLQKLKQNETFHGEEQGAILREIEKLHAAINQSTKQAEHAQEISQQLSQELNEADSRLTEKKKEIDKLKEAMREANMEALTMTPSEDLKILSENRTGIAKNGTSRRMKGSPRQLETAVPTSKNPHGVWV